MVLIRSIAVLVLALASLTAFPRGVLRDTADFWSHDGKDGKKAKSVLEKGYAPPEKIKDKKSSGADDADLLLGLMADVMQSEAAAATNTPPVRQTAPSVGKPVVKSAKPERAAATESPVAKTATTAGNAEAVEKPVANVVERVVERPVIVECTNVVERVVEKPVEVEKIVMVDRPVTNTVEVVKVEKVEKPVTNVVERVVEIERQVTNVVERVVEKPVEVEKIVMVDRPVTNTVEVVKVEKVEKPVTNVVEKVVVRQVTNVVERVVEVEKPVIVERWKTNVVEKVVKVDRPVIVERTNVVEKVVYDRSVEVRLAKDKEALERRSGLLESQRAGLEQRNDELKRELADERSRRERLERANPGMAKKAKTGRPARITSQTTQYNRKKGVAYFEGHVHVDDEEYQLHADKAYVFTEGTNDVRRIVAIGHVALTNEARRAYGGKVSYYRKDGMIVLYAGDGVNAEIRDESKAEDQTVCGSKIKFWIGSEQVEVLDATISAPTAGAGLGNLVK